MQFGLFCEAPEGPRSPQAERDAGLFDPVAHGASLGRDVARAVAVLPGQHRQQPLRPRSLPERLRQSVTPR